MRPLLIDWYCCQGGASRGYENAGFDVIGVDIYPQPHYPYPFIKGDAITLLRRLIADPLFFGRPVVANHASPPCQRYSATQRIRDNECDRERDGRT